MLKQYRKETNKFEYFEVIFCHVFFGMGEGVN